MFLPLSSELRRKKLKELNYHKDGLFKINIPFLLLLFHNSDNMKLDVRPSVREVSGICKI